MGVNIWVTGKGGDRIPICWGVGMVPDVHPTNGNCIVYIYGENALDIRETPAEIAALVAAAERKQARERIAAMALAGMMPSPNLAIDFRYCVEIADSAIKYADVLLDALATREGA